MIKKLLLAGVFLAGFTSLPSWAIMLTDGTDVGSVDTFLAEADKAGNPTAETTWVNSIIAGTTTFVIKTEPVTYVNTQTTDVFAFELASSQPDYFLIKNAKRMALFSNLADLDWGVFNVGDLSDAMNLPDTSEYEISHVTEFNGGGNVPEPSIVALLGIGLLGMVVARRSTKV